MDPQALKELILVMRDCKVASFKHNGLEITFQANESPAPAAAKVETKTASESAPIQTVKVDGMVIPTSLEEEMPYEKILNWSSPDEPDPEGPKPKEGATKAPELQAPPPLPDPPAQESVNA